MYAMGRDRPCGYLQVVVMNRDIQDGPPDLLARQLQLLGCAVAFGAEAGAAAGFVEACGADHDELLRGAEALGVDSRRAADHADGGELGDLVGQGHEVGDRAEGLIGEGGVQAGHQDALAERDELQGEWDDGIVEELDLVDADDLDCGELRVEVLAQALGSGDGDGVVGLGAVAGNGGAVVAEVDVRLVAGHALAGDARSLEAANQLLGLAGEHGAGDDLKDPGGGCVWG